MTIDLGGSGRLTDLDFLYTIYLSATNSQCNDRHTCYPLHPLRFSMVVVVTIRECPRIDKNMRSGAGGNAGTTTTPFIYSDDRFFFFLILLSI